MFSKKGANLGCLGQFGYYNKVPCIDWVDKHQQKFISYSSGGYTSDIRVLMWLGSCENTLTGSKSWSLIVFSQGRIENKLVLSPLLRTLTPS
jgi:hypothetical protein